MQVKIKQVFVNMILNACEAMEGVEDLSIRTLSIRTEKDNKWVRTYFEDTGVGMNELQMKNIFNPYYTTKPRGTGLGLAISNGIVEMHGGCIKVTSKKGVGSRFVVELTENAIESELFGSEKTNSLGVMQRTLGKIELADNGTIFLDEIGNMSLNIQAKQ